jgi:hypothetical protein
MFNKKVCDEPNVFVAITIKGTGVSGKRLPVAGKDTRATIVGFSSVGLKSTLSEGFVHDSRAFLAVMASSSGGAPEKLSIRGGREVFAVCHGSWSGPEFGDSDLCCWSSGDNDMSKCDFNGNTFDSVSEDHGCLQDMVLWCDVVLCEVWQIKTVPVVPQAVKEMCALRRSRTLITPPLHPDPLSLTEHEVGAPRNGNVQIVRPKNVPPLAVAQTRSS